MMGKLPLGWLNGKSTGAVKKTLEQNVEKVETFIAHHLPDLVHVGVTTLLMIAVMFTLNAWLVLACVVPIVVAHRLKTVQHADRIVVLDQGRIVEQDRHDELLSLNGLYARLWRRQHDAGEWRMSS